MLVDELSEINSESFDIKFIRIGEGDEVPKKKEKDGKKDRSIGKRKWKKCCFLYANAVGYILYSEGYLRMAKSSVKFRK